MSLLTDNAEDIVDRIAPWAIVSAYAFMTYALSCHIGWRDAVAGVCAFWFVARSIRARASLNGSATEGRP